MRHISNFRDKGDTETTEAWFKFSAHNTQAQYGYGTEDNASQYQDKLNWSRAINHFSFERLSEEQAKALKLDQNSEAFDLYENLVAE